MVALTSSRKLAACCWNIVATAGDSGGLAMAASARSARSRHMAASSCRAASWSRRAALSFEATRS